MRIESVETSDAAAVACVGRSAVATAEPMDLLFVLDMV
jgi:hypothetical protein